ncbi:MAG: hypothetical protein U0Z17_05225 [Bacteroidales bacterium]
MSYGMVELPAGKMKSREGTVVDADDLMQEMFDTAEAMARELGKIESFEDEEAKKTISYHRAWRFEGYFLTESRSEEKHAV